jgi:Mn2+/Fe2+ NRAMP family transporter
VAARLITRGLAIIPAVGIIGYYGEGKTTALLVGSQVVLSLQLGFAVWPLLRFTNLIAMAGHGHRLFGDLFHGSTITEVRHKTAIPLLVVRGSRK